MPAARKAPEMVRKTFGAQIKGLDEATKTITAIVTTDSVDRDGEIVLPEALDAQLPVYRTNPVLLWGHEYAGGPDRCIGRSTAQRKVANGWEFDFQYATDVNPTAKQVWDLVQGGYLSAYSIGFMPVRSICRYDDSAVIETLPEAYQEKLKSGEAWCIYTEIEIVEVSQVLIPSNRDALRRMGLAAALERKHGVDPSSPQQRKRKAALADLAARLAAQADMLDGSDLTSDDVGDVASVLEDILDDLRETAESMEEAEEAAEESGGGEEAYEMDKIPKPAIKSARRVKAGRQISQENADALQASFGHMEESVRKCVKAMHHVSGLMGDAGYDCPMPKDFPAADVDGAAADSDSDNGAEDVADVKDDGEVETDAAPEPIIKQNEMTPEEFQAYLNSPEFAAKVLADLESTLDRKLVEFQ